MNFWAVDQGRGYPDTVTYEEKKPVQIKLFKNTRIWLTLKNRIQIQPSKSIWIQILPNIYLMKFIFHVFST